MRITPVGIQGELCVAGDGVGMGYLNNPDLTKTFFIPNPFGKGVIYKTGDIAYWSSDGNIVYVGRRDEQVKIHGVRIELGEIEAAVLEHPNILQASAVVLNTEVNPQVCVYYTASDEVNSNDIRNRIAHRLPRQMLPALFVRIDSMPIASGGKVNKKALPIPDFSKSKPMTEYSAPQTELEKQVSNIIEQLLNISRVSIDDDLFDYLRMHNMIMYSTDMAYLYGFKNKRGYDREVKEGHPFKHAEKKGPILVKQRKGQYN
jgi:hypothetical protein